MDYRLGIFGPRGCGKTTYLSAIYGFGNLDKSPFRLVPKQHQARDYLGQRWELWRKERVCPPTPLNIVDLPAQLSFAARTVSIQLKDFGGAMVMRQYRSSQQLEQLLRRQIFQFLQECHAILLLLEYGSDDYREKFERRLEVEALLEVLGTRLDGSGKPLAIVVTKWDKAAVGNIREMLRDAQAQSAKSRNYVHKHHPDIFNLVSLVTAGVQVFPVSAFSSKGIADPFIWLIKQIEQAALEDCRQFQRRYRKDYRGIIAGYRRFIAGDPDPDLRRNAEAEITAISWLAARRRRRRMVVWTLLLGVLAIGGRFAWERHNFLNLEQKFAGWGTDKHAMFEQLRRASDFYLWHWVEPQRYRVLMAKCYSEILALPQLYPGERRLEWRCQVYHSFSTKFSDYARRNEFSNLIAAENNRLRAYRETQDWQALLQYLYRHNEDRHAGQCLQACTRFVRRHSHPLPQRQNRLKQYMERYRRTEQRHRFQQIQNQLTLISDPIAYCRYCLFAINDDQLATAYRDQILQKFQQKEQEVFEAAQAQSATGQNLRQKAQGYNDYLQHSFFRRYRATVEAELEALEKQVYNTMRYANQPENIDSNGTHSIAASAAQYLEHGRYRKMAPEVNTWLAWYRRARQGLSFYVTIHSAKLEPKCSIFSGVSYPDTYIVLKYGSRQIKTKEVADSWQPNYDRGFFITWSLYSSELMTIDFWCTDWTDESRSWTSSSYFMPKYINSTININDRNGNIAVRLDCSDAAWPELPAYRD